MKKKMSILLVTMLAVLSACGTKDSVVSTQIDAVAGTKEVESSVNTEIPELDSTVVASGYNDLVDWVVGEDLAVIENPTLNYMVANMPPVSVKLPAKEAADIVICDTGGTKYYISVPGTEVFVCISACIMPVGNDHCVYGFHKEFVEYGRYTIDIGNRFDINFVTTYTAIIDNEAGMSIDIVMELYDVNYTVDTLSDEDIAAYRDFQLANVEYIKQQVSSWDGSYVAPEITSDEVVTEDSTLYLNKDSGTTIQLISLFTENARIVAEDSINNDRYECELIPVADTYHKAIYNGVEILGIDITLDGLFVDTPYEEYANFYGEYTEE